MTEADANFEDLLERCILAVEGGDRAIVDGVLGAHPQHASELRRQLGRLAALGVLHAPRDDSYVPERLGEFRLLRQLGRGGMGVVYLAEQQSLARQVALKLVHPEQLFFPGARERFRREILTIARLQHPGIVPIFTCGEAEGVPYYAMELVDGCSLAEALAEVHGSAPAALDGPALRAALQRGMAQKHDLVAIADAPVFHGTWVHACCRLVAQAAEALEHAHEHGVLHRDVKPSNLLLAANGNVRLIDFGLASARGEQRLTRTGATFGSLPYMAPEQVRGATTAIDSRTDVYALGVTLYELLSLTLPYGDGSGATRERILAGLVEPPSRHNARVHADADAICLKAMDLDPARRYRTAREFGDDLEAFLAGRGVRARRASPLLRARRWTRSHPARAAATAVAFVALVPGPLVFGLQQSAAAARIQAAHDEAEAQRRLAEHNLDRAIDAVDLMLVRTAEARLADVPRTAKLRAGLLEDARRFHESLAGDAGPAADQRARESRARSLVRLAEIRADLGEVQPVVDLLREAVAEFERLLPTSPRPTQLQRELTRGEQALAANLGRADEVAESARIQRGVLARRRALLASPDVQPSDHLSMADAQLNLVMAEARDGRLDEALRLLDDIEAVLAGWREPGDGGAPRVDEAERVELWAKAAERRGVLQITLGDGEAALAAFEEALARFGPATDAGNATLAAGRAAVLEKLGHAAHQRREWERARPHLDQAVLAFEALAVREPDVPGWRARLASVLGTRAENRRQLDDLDGAGADHARAVGLLEELVLQVQAEPQYRRTLAIAYGERAQWHAARADRDAAATDHRRSIEQFEAAIALLPDDQTRGNLAAALANLAVLDATRDLPPAIAGMQRAAAITRDRPALAGTRPLIEILAMLSDFTLRNGDAPGAREILDEAKERATAWLRERPDDVERQTTAALVAINHGTLHLSLRAYAAAIAAFEAGLPAARGARPKGVYGRKLLAVLLLRLADVHLREGDLAAARRWFAAAIDEADARAADVASFEPLVALFTRPDFADLLGGAAGAPRASR